jgi:hypothetical protein
MKFTHSQDDVMKTHHFHVFSLKACRNFSHEGTSLSSYSDIIRRALVVLRYLARLLEARPCVTNLGFSFTSAVSLISLI